MKKTVIIIVLFVVIALLLIIPLLRNLLREQLGFAPYPVHSSDYLVQLAQADSPHEAELPDWSLSSPPYVAKLHHLIAKYPERPEGYAILIRNLQLNWNGVILEEQNLTPSQKASRAKFTKLFLNLAAKAQKIDPENGFFQEAKAIGLVMENRNDDALAVLAALPRYPVCNDYSYALYRGRAKQTELSRGWLCETDNMNASGVILLPHLANYRKMARMLVETAASDEQRGEIEKGYRIREIVRNFGKFEAYHARYLTEVLVGESIELTALKSHPEAASANINNELWPKQDYAKFLRERGYPHLAAQIDAAQNQIMRDENSNEIMKSKGIRQINITSAPAALRLAICYIYMVLMIAGACFAIIMTILFGILRKIARIVDDAPWAHPVLGGILGFILIGGIAVLIGRIDLSPLGINYDERHMNPISYLVAPLQPYLFIATCFSWIFTLFTSADSINNGGTVINYPNIFLGIVFAIQLFIALAAVWVSKKIGKSKFAGFMGSFVRSSIAAFCLFVLLYAALLPAMLACNNTANAQLERTTADETQLCAEAAHIQWPPRN